MTETGMTKNDGTLLQQSIGQLHLKNADLERRLAQNENQTPMADKQPEFLDFLVSKFTIKIAIFEFNSNDWSILNNYCISQILGFFFECLK